MTTLAVLVLAPALCRGQTDEAKTLAQKILDEGAALFDTRDAKAMAATYVASGVLTSIKRDSDSGQEVVELAQGRAAIEKAYADLFKGRQPAEHSRNTVDLARFLGPNLLLIHGRFALDRTKGDTIQFVQIRAREGDRWRIASLQMIELSDRNP